MTASSDASNARQFPHSPGTYRATASESESSRHSIRLALLGGFRLSAGWSSLESTDWRRKKAGNLVKLLALSPQRRLNRDWLLDELWPNLGVTAAQNNFRVTLHWARRLLDSRLRVPDLIQVSGETVEFSPEVNLVIDVDEFESAAAIALKSATPLLYEQAIALYGGDLLPEDPYAEWALARRDQLRQLRLELIVGLGHLHEGRREYDAAIRLAQEAVDLDPLREDAHLLLMRSYVLDGNRHAALRQFELLGEVIQRDLGAHPEPASRRLYEDIRDGRFPDPSDSVVEIARHRREEWARTRLRPAPRHNLPSSLVRFIGRGQQVADLSDRLDRYRLVTVVGSGGAGKTTLALNLAGRLIDDFPDGVWLVELASINSGDLVIQAVASALGIREERQGQLLDRLIEDLQAREMLLVLDNCEHLIDAAAELASQLLSRCDDLKILATSREALGVVGESVLRLRPMEVPDSVGAMSLEEIASADAVALFIDRAATTWPEFAPNTRDQIVDIWEICRRLDGLPLAIELAASRAGVLPVRRIAERLDDALSLLTTGPRSAPSRQQTLRATLDWSYDLLNPSEQSLLQRCSVFAGGFTLEAAEVLAGHEDDSDRSTLDSVASLINKSLLRRDVLPDGGHRFGILETVRAYGWEQLGKSGLLEDARQRHAEYFLDEAERMQPLVYGEDGETWLDAFEREHDNIRQAIGWFELTRSTEKGLRMTSAMAPFWWMRGYLSEGLGHLQRMLDLPAETRTELVARARALGPASVLAESRDDYDLANTMANEAVLLHERLAEPDGVQVANLCLGVVAYKVGARETARQHWEAAVNAARAADHPWHLGMALNNLGSHAIGEQELDTAVKWLEKSLRVARSIGSKALIAQPLAYLGQVEILRGNYPEAERMLVESLQLFDEVRELRFAGRVLGSLALVALKQSDLERSRAWCLQSIGLLWDRDERYHLAQSLDVLAQLSVQHGNMIYAVRLFGAIDALRSAIGSPIPPESSRDHEAALTALQKAVDEVEFRSAWEDGRQSSLDDVVATLLHPR